MGNEIGETFQAYPKILLDISTSSELMHSQEHFIIKQMVTQSPEHHQQLISLITKFKQYQSFHIVKLIDAHSVQSHNLCSILSHLYLIFEKPAFTLTEYKQKLREKGEELSSQLLKAILIGCSRGIEYLRKEGNELSRISESGIFLDEDERGDIIVKLMNPYFDEEFLLGEHKSIEVQLVEIVKPCLSKHIAPQLINIIDELYEGTITMKEMEEELTDSNAKRGKTGLKLMKDMNRRQLKVDRQSMDSVISNTSSLMIDGGNESHLMLKHFYQHFDDHTSQLSNSKGEYVLTNGMANDKEGFHQFPKRYLKNKAFRTINRTTNESIWSEEGKESFGWSELKGKGQSITRDQSLKENVLIQSKKSLNQSGKLVESFVSACKE